MESYSLDLRQRIIDAVARGEQTKRDIVVWFGVHESFIYKLILHQLLSLTRNFDPFPEPG